MSEPTESELWAMAIAQELKEWVENQQVENKYKPEDWFEEE